MNYHFISAISVRNMNEKLKPEREKVIKYTCWDREQGKSQTKMENSFGLPFTTKINHATNPDNHEDKTSNAKVKTS